MAFAEIVRLDDLWLISKVQNAGPNRATLIMAWQISPQQYFNLNSSTAISFLQMFTVLCYPQLNWLFLNFFHCLPTIDIEIEYFSEQLPQFRKVLIKRPKAQ